MNFAQAQSFASLTEARVTSRLGDLKRSVVDLGDRLEAEVHGRAAGFLNNLLDELESHTCRIAVIGQIKAGKSSLINALMRRPDLLPTDINPATAVITKLRFGAPAEKHNTALFHFFSDEEWERIMSGGRLGAMAAQRYAAFRAEDIQGPLEELRRRAEQRLGANYAQLLGKHHLLSAVTPEALERYVSAGDYASDEARADGDGLFYSDITKTAEIFLEGQPLGYPSVIIDTPGVNDPFLVRDEITQNDLGDADIYLVVLTAQQPLSRSDLALLRMLKGLQKDRIIAVVNRVDIVDGIAAKGEKLIQHVRGSLKREFPHADIPVILASARWGNAALRAQEEEMAEVLTPALADYAETLSLRGENTLGRPGAGWPAERMSQLLYQVSGIPAIVSSIAQHIGHSVTTERLLPTALTVGAIADNTAISVRYGIKTLQTVNPITGRTGDAWFRSHAYANLERLENLLTRVEHALETAQRDFATLTQVELDRLRRFMTATATNFAERMSARLTQLGSYAALRPEFQEGGFELRSQLAEDFYKYFTETAKRLLGRQQEAENSLRRVMTEAMPDLDEVLRFGYQAGDMAPSSIIPLSKVTALDTDEFWLARLRAPAPSVEEAAEFRKMVTSAYAELIEELFWSADDTFKEHEGAGLRRLRFLSYSVIYPIAQQLQQWVEAHKAAAGEAPWQTETRAASLREEILTASRAHLLRCEKLAVDSAGIRQQCIYMMEN